MSGRRKTDAQRWADYELAMWAMDTQRCHEGLAALVAASGTGTSPKQLSHRAVFDMTMRYDDPEALWYPVGCYLFEGYFSLAHRVRMWAVNMSAAYQGQYADAVHHFGLKSQRRLWHDGFELRVDRDSQAIRLGHEPSASGRKALPDIRPVFFEASIGSDLRKYVPEVIPARGWHHAVAILHERLNTQDEMLGMGLSDGTVTVLDQQMVDGLLAQAPTDWMQPASAVASLGRRSTNDNNNDSADVGPQEGSGLS